MATRVPGGYNPAAVAITGGTIKLDDGAVGSPFIAPASDPTTGYFKSGTSAWTFAAGGVASMTIGGSFVQLTSSGSYAWTSTAASTGSADTTLSRDGPGQMALKGASNAAAESRVYAGNGGFISQVKSVTESLTIAAAATTVSATSIPAGAILLAVSVRVTTIIPTAATFTITTTVGGTTLNTAAVTVASGSTDPGTAAGASYRAAATTVTITPNLTPGTATGVVRLQFYYLQVTPPTS